MTRSLKELLNADPETLRAWHMFGDGRSEDWQFELELRCATAEEQEAFLRKHGRKEPKPQDYREFWLDHVLDWRGFDSSAPYDRAEITKLWKKDSEFREWVVSTCKRLDNFR